MRVEFRLPAEDHCLFSPHAFSKSIGRPFNLNGHGERTLVDAIVVDGGKAAVLTIELEEGDIPWASKSYENITHTMDSVQQTTSNNSNSD